MFIAAFVLLILVGVPVAIAAGLRLRVGAAIDRGAAIAEALGYRRGPPQKSMHWYLGDERGRAAGAHPELVPPTVLPEAPAILTHDVIGGANDAEQVRHRIQAMRDVVTALDGGGGPG